MKEISLFPVLFMKRTSVYVYVCVCVCVYARARVLRFEIILTTYTSLYPFITSVFWSRIHSSLLRN